MNTMRHRLGCIALGITVLGLTACAKKEMNVGRSELATDKMAITERAADNTLAYEHEVSLEVGREELARRVEAVRAACTADTKSACTILEVSVNDDSGYATGRIKMRLAPGGVDALVNAASTDAKVKVRQTNAEDLAQPLADVARQVAMLSAYRERLSALLARKDTNVADLISLSKELAATQTQLEQLTNQNAQLRRRIDTDLLTITWQVPASQARSAEAPVRDAMSSFGANFREAIGSVIEFLAQLIPWLVIGLPALVLLRMFWRWTGNWLSRRVRTG